MIIAILFLLLGLTLILIRCIYYLMPHNGEDNTFDIDHDNEENSLIIHTVFGRPSQTNRIRFAEVQKNFQHDVEEMESLAKLFSESDYKMTHVTIEGIEEELNENIDSKTIASERELAVHTADDIDYFNPKPGPSKDLRKEKYDILKADLSKDPDKEDNK